MPGIRHKAPKASNKPKKSGGGSFWGHLGFLAHNPVNKEVSRLGHDAASMAYHAPGGTYLIGKSIASQFDPRHIGDPHHNPLGNLIINTYKEAAKSLTPRQIVKHPGFAAVSALGFLDPALRAATVPGRVAKVARAEKAASATRKSEEAHLARLDMAAHMKNGGMTAAQIQSRAGVSAGELAAHMRSPDTKYMLKHGNMSGGKYANVTPHEVLHNPSKYPRALVRAYTKRYPDEAKSAGLIKKKKGTGTVPQYRTQTFKSRSIPEEKVLRKAEGSPLSTKRVQGKVGTRHRVDIPLSYSPATRAFQRGLGKAQNKAAQSSVRSVRRFGMRPVLKQAARKSDIEARHKLKAPGLTFPETLAAIKENPKIYARQSASLRGVIPELNAFIRGTRLYRPAYLLPNLAGGLSANIFQGALGPQNLAAARALTKTHPGTGQRIAALTGGGLSHAAAKAQGPFSSLSREQPGLVQGITAGIGESAGKVTDVAPRVNAFVKEARRHGYDTEAKIHDLIERGTKKNAPAHLKRDLNRIVQRAEDSSFRFSSSHAPLASARLSNAIVRNTFLGSWLRASARYGAHFVANHPHQAMLLAAAGKNAPTLDKVQKDLPDFLKYALPVGAIAKKTGLNHILQTGSYSLFDYPFDVANQVKSSKQDLRNIIGPLQPTTHFAGEALTGYDPFTGIELSNPSTRERLLFALANEGVLGSYSPFVPAFGPHYGGKRKVYAIPGRQGSRFYDTKEQRARRLFPRSKWDVLFNWLLGGSFYPTPENPEVASKMARNQKDHKKSSKKKKAPKKIY